MHVPTIHERQCRCPPMPISTTFSAALCTLACAQNGSLSGSELMPCRTRHLASSIASCAGISDSEESTQKWAATIAFSSLQTTNYNESTAQVLAASSLRCHEFWREHMSHGAVKEAAVHGHSVCFLIGLHSLI